jgi:hypothetical protein
MPIDWPQLTDLEVAILASALAMFAVAVEAVEVQYAELEKQESPAALAYVEMADQLREDASVEYDRRFGDAE